MIIHIEIPDSPEDFSLAWEPGFKISTRIFDSSEGGKSLLISLNSAGLLSLARYLLMLSRPEISVGHHYHFDDSNSLESGSVEMIIEKLE